MPKAGEVKAVLIGVLLLVAARLIDGSPVDRATHLVLGNFIALLYLLAVLMGGAGVASYGLRWAWRTLMNPPSLDLVKTLGEDGWLTRQDLREYAGEGAMRAQGHWIRPGLPAYVPGTRRKQPITEYATCVGRLVSGHGRVYGRRVYSPHSRGILVLGPTGSGKTSWLIHPLLDFPGGVYVTSTSPELIVMTTQFRELIGPVHVFNPSGLGGVGSSFGWDPVAACRDQSIAEARAWAFVRGGGGAAGIDRPDFWARKAQEIIRCYLMAAALRGWDMGAVHYWATNPDDQTPVGILQAHPESVPAAWLGTLHTNLTAAHNTRSGYFATVVSCVGFMDNPQVAAACRPQPGQNFNLEKFLAGGTLYVIGSKEDTRLAPLLTAMTEDFYGRARRIAADSPGLRLAHGLGMILDEVAHITPVPLDQWAADSREPGITVVAVIQDLAQPRTTWGTNRAKTIYSNLPTKVVLPGVGDPEDLESLAYLAGTRDVERVSKSMSSEGISGQARESTNVTPTIEPVIRGATIYGLPPWHAYVLGLCPRPAVVQFEPGYERVERLRRKLGVREGNSRPPGRAGDRDAAGESRG